MVARYFGNDKKGSIISDFLSAIKIGFTIKNFIYYCHIIRTCPSQFHHNFLATGGTFRCYLRYCQFDTIACQQRYFNLE